MGGLTTFDAEETSRAESTAIALAGPATGIFVGLFAMAIGQLFPPVMRTPIFQDLMLVTFGWSLLNLVPALPLDGGLLLSAVLRHHSSLIPISIAVATAAVAICAIARQTTFSFSRFS